jgi:uroporphyrinogen decarboxylase
MRQAGRYLPEYQEMRKRHSFAQLCTTPDLAVEVSLQPYRRFGFDAVIVFYDILFLAQSMGAPVEFTEAGPVFRRPVAEERDLDALHPPDVHGLDPRTGTGAILRVIGSLRSELPRSTAVLGFAGGPFTMAGYLLGGAFERSGERIRRLIHDRPSFVHRLCERLAAATAEYLEAQVAAGADAVQLFDTWAGVLGPEAFREFALPYEKAALKKAAEAGAPTILYINGGSHLLEDMRSSGAAVLSLDWREPLARARSRLGGGISLQGNLDPAALFATPEEVLRLTRSMLESLSGDPAYIVNLGHGILPETPISSVEAFVRAVKEFQAREKPPSPGSSES